MVIAVVTSSRADWGLLEKVCKEIKHDTNDDLMLIVAGTHWCPSYGYTASEVVGIVHDDDLTRVEHVLDSNTPMGTIRSLALAGIGISQSLEKIKPYCILLLGDRYETLAAAIAAYINRIPICHISGGEVTSGSMDNAFRHSITKMASLHFVPTELCRKRVVQLGEHPDTVFNVGSLGCDGLEYFEDKSKYVQRIMLIYHPETLGQYSDISGLIEILKTRKEIIQIISPNSDNGRWNILNQLKPLEVNVQNNITRDIFLADLMMAKVIVGNSSAGIVEAPAVGTPTINIGDRQAGREMADSIVNCDGSKESIEQAFEKVFSPEFQKMMAEGNYYRPYQGENVAQQIVDIIKQKLPKVNLKKGFYDLP